MPEMAETTPQGAHLGKYSLIAEIARGGMGIVYLAQASGRHGFKKVVVVKELKPELGEDERFREMFLDEAKLAARLNHRNIVQTIEVDEEDGRYFFVMEYLDGQTLHHISRLKGDKALSGPSFARILCDVLAGLHYAHELKGPGGSALGVVHRDVSPRNIFVTYDGQVKVLDFGVAKAAGRDQQTEAGELKGRVPYMAPEHVSDSKIDRRADIFSIGVLLREALTGKRIWDTLNEIEILRELLQKRIPPLPEDANVPDEVRAILAKAMAPERDDRYATANEMRIDLERWVLSADPNGSFDAIGDHLTKQFAKHRAFVQSMVDKHVEGPDSVPPAAGVLPTVPGSVNELPTGGSKPGSRTGSHPSYGSGPNDATQPGTPAPMSPPPEAPPAAARAKSNPSFPAIDTPVKAQPAPPRSEPKDISVPPPPAKSKAGTYILGAVGFAAVVAVLVALMLSMQKPPTPTEPVDIGSPTSTLTERPRPNPPPTASAPQAEMVEVTIHATPPLAKIWIDEDLIGTGPHTHRYKKGSQHTVRAAYPGFVTKTETYDFNAAASFRIELDREKDASAPPGMIPSVKPPAPGVPTSRN